jgi:hypothetical protein
VVADLDSLPSVLHRVIQEDAGVDLSGLVEEAQRVLG